MIASICLLLSAMFVLYVIADPQTGVITPPTMGWALLAALFAGIAAAFWFEARTRRTKASSASRDSSGSSTPRVRNRARKSDTRTSRRLRVLAIVVLTACSFSKLLIAQTALTWEDLRARFEATNPTLKAAALNIDEARAAEITAYLRPNPDFGFSVDGTQLTPYAGIYRPFAGTQFSPSVSYLHERQHKRELRLDQAKESTEAAASTYLDQQRNLLFNLRSAFVNVLQAKVFFQNATENIEYWDRELEVDRRRLAAGDLAQIDVDRLELQRTTFKSDYQTALVNLRTAKIQLLMLLNDRTPIDKFDVTGPYDFSDSLQPLDEYRRLALETRPDLKASAQNVELARITYKLAVSNGSTDPTYSI